MHTLTGNLHSRQKQRLRIHRPIHLERPHLPKLFRVHILCRKDFLVQRGPTPPIVILRSNHLPPHRSSKRRKHHSNPPSPPHQNAQGKTTKGTTRHPSRHIFSPNVARVFRPVVYTFDFYPHQGGIATTQRQRRGKSPLAPPASQFQSLQPANSKPLAVIPSPSSAHPVTSPPCPPFAPQSNSTSSPAPESHSPPFGSPNNPTHSATGPAYPVGSGSS